MRFRVVVVLLPLLAALAVAAFTVPGSAEDEEGREAIPADIRALGEAYLKAYEAGDAAALVKCFTSNAEYTTAGGAVYRGRLPIHSLAQRFFMANPGVKLEVEAGELRILGEAIATKDGVATIRSADGKVLARSRFTALYTRDGGRWLCASLRDYELREGVARDRLEQVAFLVGDWIEETEEATIESSCRWSEDGPYLMQTFKVTAKGGETRSSTQRIAWDPLLRKIRSWIWDSDGGLGEAIWTRLEDGFALQSRGVSSAGVVGTGLYRILPQGEDAFRWEATQQTVGEETVEDRFHLIVRRPPEPK